MSKTRCPAVGSSISETGCPAVGSVILDAVLVAVEQTSGKLHEEICGFINPDQLL
jgi:hypothetical protein